MFYFLSHQSNNNIIKNSNSKIPFIPSVSQLSSSAALTNNSTGHLPFPPNMFSAALNLPPGLQHTSFNQPNDLFLQLNSRYLQSQQQSPPSLSFLNQQKGQTINSLPQSTQLKQISPNLYSPSITNGTSGNKSRHQPQKHHKWSTAHIQIAHLINKIEKSAHRNGNNDKIIGHESTHKIIKPKPLSRALPFMTTNDKPLQIPQSLNPLFTQLPIGPPPPSTSSILPSPQDLSSRHSNSFGGLASVHNNQQQQTQFKNNQHQIITNNNNYKDHDNRSMKSSIINKTNDHTQRMSKQESYHKSTKSSIPQSQQSKDRSRSPINRNHKELISPHMRHPQIDFMENLRKINPSGWPPLADPHFTRPKDDILHHDLNMFNLAGMQTHGLPSLPPGLLPGGPSLGPFPQFPFPTNPSAHLIPSTAHPSSANNSGSNVPQDFPFLPPFPLHLPPTVPNPYLQPPVGNINNSANRSYNDIEREIQRMKTAGYMDPMAFVQNPILAYQQQALFKPPQFPLDLQSHIQQPQQIISPASSLKPKSNNTRDDKTISRPNSTASSSTTNQLTSHQLT